jgi:drug/metabolite transporter (DMT)-like permease
MLISAVLMGNVGLLVWALELAGYSTYAIVLLRGLSGTLFLTFFMIKYHSFSKGFLKESFKLHWKSLIIIGVSNPVIIYLYFENMRISGLAIAAFLMYTSGIFALIFLIIGRMEKVAKLNFASFFLAIIGVGLIMEFWTGQTLAYGIFLGILSGLILGIQIVFIKKIYIDRNKNNSKINTKGDIDILMAWWPTLFLVLMFLPFGVVELVHFTLLDLVWVLLLGLLPTAIAFVLYNIGMKNDKGGNILILSYIEPLVATLIAIILAQPFSIFTIIGGSLILLANIIILIVTRKKNES